MAWRQTLRVVFSYHQMVILILVPLVLLPLPLQVGSQEARCAYVVLITAIFWMTEVMPLAVTSLLPALLFPMLDVNSIEAVATRYLREINMLFIGSLMVAIAVEESMLHKRVALRVLLLAGTDIKWLMLGCMLVTWFLSMWITNTSATAMMLPIVQAVLIQIEDVSVQVDVDESPPNHDKTTGPPVAGVELTSMSDSGYINTAYNDATPGESTDDISVQVKTVSTAPANSNDEQQQGETKNTAEAERLRSASIRKGMLLCIAYAANIGGSATLTGTPPNLELAGQLDTFYGHGVSGINFASWLIFSVPSSFVTLLLAWCWLTIMFMGWRSLICCGHMAKRRREREAGRRERIRRVMRTQYDELGPMSFNEGIVLALFIVLALLWIGRNPAFIPNAKGWGALFTKGYVKDSTAALLIAISFFILPREMPKWKSDKVTPKILDWKTVQVRLPWNVVLLMGAGFAIAANVQKSGLSSWIGSQLHFLSSIAPSSILFILCCIVAGVTELASNTATAVIIIPILKELSINLSVHPLYLMLPCVISASFAFMLPVATPPNALVFSTGDLKITDMMKCGLLMNLICISVLQLSINTYGVLQFGLDTFPPWALGTHLATTTAAPAAAVNCTVI